jgi:hypothetical protein
MKSCLYLTKFNILREETDILKWEWILIWGENIKKCFYSVCIYVCVCVYVCVCACVKMDCCFLSFLFPTAYLIKGTQILLWFFYFYVIIYMTITKFGSNRESIFVYHTSMVVVVCVTAGKFKERHFGISMTVWTASKLTNEWKFLKLALIHFSTNHIDCGIGLCCDLCVRSNRLLEKKWKKEH